VDCSPPIVIDGVRIDIILYVSVLSSRSHEVHALEFALVSVNNGQPSVLQQPEEDTCY